MEKNVGYWGEGSRGLDREREREMGFGVWDVFDLMGRFRKFGALGRSLSKLLGRLLLF